MMMNTPDYLAEQSLIELSRLIRETLEYNLEKLDQATDFDLVFPGFFPISQENSNESS